jgi:hypothetical protein
MRFAAACLGILALQWALVSRAGFGCATPDLPLAFALYIGLNPGGAKVAKGFRKTGDEALPVFGLWALGLCIDLLGPYPTGFHAAAFLGLAWGARLVAGRFDPASPRVRGLVLAGGSLLLRGGQLAVLAAEGAMPAIPKACHFLGTSAVLTTVVGFLGFQLFDSYGRRREAPLTT